MKEVTYSKSRMLPGVCLLFVILCLSNNCSKSSSSNTSNPGPNEVWIQGMSFNPATITVNSGTEITWTNKDGIAHTVTSNTGAFDSGTLNSNGTYSHLFSTAGSFPYHCTIHPNMTATVIVN